METTSHDHNFKNFFQDFPQEALDWILPDVRQKLGQILKVEFVRQEPKKQKLTDSGFDLDMPILFSFEQQKVLLWLMEFQENKSRFSIYKLLRYATDLLEAHEDAIMIPTVLFTDRKKLIVPTAPAWERLRWTLERPGLCSHAGAWERSPK